MRTSIRKREGFFLQDIQGLKEGIERAMGEIRMRPSLSPPPGEAARGLKSKGPEGGFL